MKTIGIREARENLRSIIDLAEHEEVVILVHGKPKARIIGTRGESLGEIAERAALEPVRERMAAPSDEPVPLEAVRARLEGKWKPAPKAKPRQRTRRAPARKK